MSATQRYFTSGRVSDSRGRLLLTAKKHHVQNIYTMNDFKRRLLLEKCRAQRAQAICSLLAFDLSDYLLDPNNGHLPWCELEEVILHMSRILRNTDAICGHKSHLVLFLLSDIDAEKTTYVSEKVKHELFLWRKQALGQNEWTMENFSTKKLTFPADKILSPNHKKINFELPQNHSSHRFQTVNLNEAGFGNISGLSMPIIVNSPLRLSLIHPFIDILFWHNRLLTDIAFDIQRFLKRLVDILGALICTVTGLPLLLLIAIIIKTTSKGPVIFKQVRIGYRGKPFIFFKFRTMRHKCSDVTHRDYVTKLIKGSVKGEKNEKTLFKIEHDCRTTPFGKFLRTWSLDELPQLLNVLIGDMSLVGPRPPLPYEVEAYEPWHIKRLEVRPGITGLWQVTGRSRTTFNEMVRLDIKYINSWSWLWDFKILFKTIHTVWTRDGAV